MGHNKPWRHTKYIVNDERTFAYLVVPKVACSSVKTALMPLLPSKGSRRYREFYDRRLAALVGERYRLDAEIFGYAF